MYQLLPHFWPSNFGRLVLVCIDADYYDQILVGKLSPRSTCVCVGRKWMNLQNPHSSRDLTCSNSISIFNQKLSDIQYTCSLFFFFLFFLTRRGLKGIRKKWKKKAKISIFLSLKLELSKAVNATLNIQNIIEYPSPNIGKSCLKKITR